MSINAEAWLFPSHAEQVIVDYLLALLPQNLQIEAAPNGIVLTTPSVTVRHADVSPYTDDAAIIAHATTRTHVTIRTAMRPESMRNSRALHDELVSHVMGCIMVVNGSTGENALPAELNAVGNAYVNFSLARWRRNSPSVDDENMHLLTRIELETVINPKGYDNGE